MRILLLFPEYNLFISRSPCYLGVEHFTGGVKSQLAFLRNHYILEGVKISNERNFLIQNNNIKYLVRSYYCTPYLIGIYY